MKQAASWLVLAASLLMAPAAIAKHPTPQETEAKQHYQNGMTHYDLGEYAAAIDEFKVAYTLSNEPGLLFNIAQAYRLARDWEQARAFYERYLGLAPDAPNRADVEAQLAKVRAELAAQQEAAAAAAKLAPAPAPLPAAAASVPEPRPRFVATRRGRATVALAAVAGAAAVAAAVTGGLALGTRADYDRGCSRGPCNGALFDSGRHLAIATDVAIGVAVVAGATALVLALTRPRARDLRVGWAF